MASLTNTKIKDTYDGLLKTTDNDALGGTYKLITDGLGNSSDVYLGTGGRLGVGVPSPSVPLHVQGFARFVGGIQLEGNNRTIYATSNTNLLIGTNNTERMRIDSSGNVGIGDSSPSYLFNIKGTEERIGIKDTSAGETWNNTDLGGFVFRTHYATQEKTGMYAVGLPHGTGVNYQPQLEFKTSNTTRLTINPNGNVGIGTTDPQKKLVISESTNATIRINSTKNGTWSAEEGLGHLEFFGNDTSGEGAAVKAKISATSKDTFGSAFNMTFGTTDGTTGISERMRIRYDGFVGIGETDPDRQLHLKSSLPAIRLEDSDVSGLYHEFFASTAGMFQFKADGGNVQSGSGFLFEVDGSEKMRIQSGGTVLVGKTSSSSTTTGVELNPVGLVQVTRNNNLPLLVNRTGTDGIVVSIRNDNTEVGSISVSGSTTSYNETSDYRLKENVVDMTGALDRVEQLQPKRFNFISEETTVDGFIAHEVQSVIPEAVFGEKDAVDEDGNPEYQGIDKSKIVPLLVGAIKELKAEIETLKSQINS